MYRHRYITLPAYAQPQTKLTKLCLEHDLQIRMKCVLFGELGSSKNCCEIYPFGSFVLCMSALISYSFVLSSQN